MLQWQLTELNLYIKIYRPEMKSAVSCTSDAWLYWATENVGIEV